MSFDLNKDADALRKAMKGLGTDEDAIIKIVANRTNAYRQKLITTYKGNLGRDLISDLKSELGGKLEDVVVGMFLPPVDYLCSELRRSMKGAGTDEQALLEILVSQNNAQMKELKKRYHEMYNRDLEKDVKSDTSGDFEKILVSLLQANRSENTKPNMQDCEAKANQLYDAGAKKLGTDEETFNRIFATSSKAELTTIAQCYHKKTGKTILEAVDSELSGNMKKVYTGIVYALLSPSEYFAKRFYESMKGAGTRDKDLMRLCICRDEVDMPQIKQFYKQLYKKDLVDAIKSETSGDYKKILVEIVSH